MLSASRYHRYQSYHIVNRYNDNNKNNLAITNTRYYWQHLLFMKGYKDLEIYNLTFNLAIKIYRLSLNLPHPDKFETGSQIRRSSQSVKDNIVEGYGRRRYKADFIKFLVASHASCLEATSQAEFLASVHPESDWKIIAQELDKAGIKISNFIKYVEKNWKT